MLYTLEASEAGVSRGLDMIDERLRKLGLKKKEIVKSMLLAEEIMNLLLSHGTGNGAMQLSIRRFLDEVTIEIWAPGQAFDFNGELSLGVSLDQCEIGPDAQNAIRAMILRSAAEDLKYRHRGEINGVRMTVLKSRHAMLYKTLGAMALAIVLGLLLKFFAPPAFCDGLSSNLLSPIKTMFMNALKAVVAPVVFFSIVSCIGQFSNLKEMGRVGSRVIIIYMLTTLMATGVGVGLFYLFKPGNPAAAATGEAVALAQNIDVSIKDTIVNIVPGNFLKPFLEANMLQLIFLAVLCGAAVGMIGKYSQMLSDLFTACNELFLKITTLLVKWIPLVSFCSICAMLLQTGMDALASILSMLGVFVLGLMIMMGLYCLMMVVFSRLNPKPFLKKYLPTMMQVFSMASSNAALPLNMGACKKLGVSPQVYSLALPLGATINMDGTCVYLSVFALALARVYGIEIPAGALLSVVISIIVLSIGAPGVPGSGLICLSVLLTQLGVPVGAVGLVMGIDPLVGMMRTMNNCLGDVAACCMVAKREKLMDMEKYQLDK